MTHEDFDQLVSKSLACCQTLLGLKSRDYDSVDDRLSNFKRVGQTIGLTPEQVCLVYLGKHLDSIVRHCSGNPCVTEDVELRITDAINYLLLLQGLLIDGRPDAG